jgi:hypothetical protein
LGLLQPSIVLHVKLRKLFKRISNKLIIYLRKKQFKNNASVVEEALKVRDNTLGKLG